MDHHLQRLLKALDDCLEMDKGGDLFIGEGDELLAAIDAAKAANEGENYNISLVWHVDDVLQQRPDLTLEQCIKVLDNIENNHDANYGVSWEIIDCVAEHLFPEDIEEDTEE
jgi:hypothetical protein